MVLTLLKIQYTLVYARKNQPKHGITTVHVIKCDLSYDLLGGETWHYHCACVFKHLTVVYVQKQPKYGITMFHVKKKIFTLVYFGTNLHILNVIYQTIWW